MISNIGKSTRHVSCLYSEGKAIKATSLKVKNTHFHRLRETLKIGWQSLGGL